MSTLAQTPALPDQLDILRGADTTPQMQFVLDSSGSMGTILLPTPNCPYYADTFKAPSDPACARCSSCMLDSGCQFTRMDMLKAVLTGCQNPVDGVLDQWSSRVMFAVRAFGTNGTDGLTPNGGFDTSFGNSVALQNDVLMLSPSGQTPLGEQYAAAGDYIANSSTGFFAYDGNRNTPKCGSTSPGGACNNTLACRQNYIMVLSDGASNGPQSTYDFVSANPSTTVSDLSGTAPYTDIAARYMVRDVSSATGALIDAMDKVAGSQQIRTYTVAFDAPTNAQQLLQDMATEGDGEYHDATSYQALSDAFRNVILSVVARSNVAFSTGTLQSDGLFSGNFAYVTSFRPFDDGYWLGTTKKYCVDPAEAPISDPANTDCMFLRVPAALTGRLFTNPNPVDQWTLTNKLVATVGGSGARVNLAMGTNPLAPMIFPGSAGCTSCSPAVPALAGNPYGGRRILTWDPGTADYLEIADPSSLNPAFTRTSGNCNHARLVNKIFGYTNEVRGPSCAGTDLWPVAVDAWPTGDTANGSTTMIRYGDDCRVAGDCFLAVSANDGAMHFIDAANGDEISMVIPGNFFAGDLSVENAMADLMDQPNLTSMRRYYFDGKSRLYHEDKNGNGVIDGAETAYLIAGLGRGGKMYIKWDMSTPAHRFTGDPLGGASAPAAGTHPPMPLMVDTTTGLSHLRDTWAAPWVGPLVATTDQQLHRTAVFPSGHTATDDVITGTFAQIQPGLSLPPDDNANYDSNVPCAAVGIPSELCDFQAGIDGICASQGVSSSFCDLTTCTPGYTGTLFANGDPANKPCYDDPTWTALAGTTSAPNPLYGASYAGGYDLTFGPYVFSSSGRTGLAYRIVFAQLDLQPGDQLRIEDAQGRLVQTFTGPQAPGTVSQWVYSPKFQLTFVSDGNDAGPARLWAIDRIHVQRTAPAGLLTPTTQPTIYVVDLDLWNDSGASPANQRTFSAVPTNNRQGSSLLARFTRDCTNPGVAPNEHCVDQTMQPDLAYMTCPISAQVTVFREGGRFRTAYVGDECGQIWVFHRDPSDSSGATAWKVRRLIHLNNVDSAGYTVSGDSANFRKIFTKLDLVVSTCPGRRVLGVYFGTGDVQRPAAIGKTLQDGRVTDPNNDTPAPSPAVVWPPLGAAGDRDVYGVVWDDGAQRNLQLGDLFDVTNLSNTDPQATRTKNGYFIRAFASEKILRDPLVIDGVAYFKTYQATRVASECVSAEGVDYVYAFDNCTAAPVVGTTAADRSVWSGQTDIGGGLMLYTPRTGPPVVTAGSTGSPLPEDAVLPTRPNRRALRLYMWRLTPGR